MILPQDLRWTDAPPSLPPGAKIALMEGDPTREGAFTMRIRLPANYRIPAHHHPADEHVTVISGSFYMGLGDRLDTTRGRALSPGSFAMMKAGTRHFAFTRKPAVIQLHGIGPWGIVYVDPKDDPRKR
ncbi:MAG: cupin domain-containing protein [Armatimonadetes bacterium]|nr:cupin domain-containing protein [Armatimonadota bacterium]